MEEICPYCEELTEFDDSDMYESNEHYEVECNHCKKTFQVYLEYEKLFTPNATPCLNGEDHAWRQIVGAPSIHFKGKYLCTHCDARKEVKSELATKEEWDSYFNRVVEKDA
ncbi:hypothetical protein KAR91_84545 [Candidatus Pacearchaeota archaeon]|nr:hypothetical protein [Candidatus Pacearchaeota archaeon]